MDTPNKQQMQEVMDINQSISEMNFILNELSKLESLITAAPAESSASLDYANHSFAFEKKLAALLDHFISECTSIPSLDALLDHRDTRLTCIRVISELNPDRKRAHWSTQDYVPSVNKNLETYITSNKESLFDDFLQKLNQHLSWSNLPAFSPEQANPLKEQYLRQFDSMHNHPPHVSADSDSILEKALLNLVEIFSDPDITFPKENISLLRRIAKMISDEILQSFRSQQKDFIVLSRNDDFIKNLRAAWENYAFSTYANSAPSKAKTWKRKNHVILDKSWGNILHNLNAIQESFWEARLIPILLFLVCAMEARSAFDSNKKRNERSENAQKKMQKSKASYAQEINGRYFLLRENHYLFPKTKKFKQKQFDASIKLFVNIRKLILDTLPQGAIPTLRSGGVHAREIDDYTLTHAKNQYFPYVVSCKTRYALYKILKQLDTIHVQTTNDNTQNSKSSLYEKREHIEALFICMILADCRNAHLSKLPNAINCLVQENCIDYLKALIEVTKSQNVIRFFAQKEKSPKEFTTFKHSLDLLYNLLFASNSSSDSTNDHHHTIEDKSEEKYIKIAQELGIYLEDVNPYLFLAITEFSPTAQSFLDKDFPLCYLDETILFALPEAIESINEVIYQQLDFSWKEAASICDPLPIIESIYHEYALTYAYELFGLLLAAIHQEIKWPSESEDISKHNIVEDLSNIIYSQISNFMNTYMPLTVLHDAISPDIINEIKEYFSISFSDSLSAMEKTLKEHDFSVKDPFMPKNKFTYAANQEERRFNYILSQFFLSSKEAVLTALILNFYPGTQTQCIQSIPIVTVASPPDSTFTKQEGNRWNFQVTTKFFEKAETFTDINAFLHFLQEHLNIALPLETNTDSSGQYSFADIVTISAYLEHCLFLSQNCIIQKLHELILKHDQQFYPLRVTKSNIGLAKLYYHPSKEKTIRENEKSNPNINAITD